MEVAASAVPVFVSDDLSSLSPGTSLELAPETDRRAVSSVEEATIAWSGSSVELIELPEPGLRLRSGSTGAAPVGFDVDCPHPVWDWWGQALSTPSAERMLAETLDWKAVHAQLEQAETDSGTARTCCRLVAAFWFGILPASALIHGLVLPGFGVSTSRNDWLVGLGVAYGVLLCAHHVVLWRLHRLWFPKRFAQRVGKLAMHTVSPADVMLCLGPMAAQHVAGRHPVTASRATGDAAHSAAVRLLRNLAVSRGASAALTATVTTALQDAGVDVASALSKPSPDSPASHSFCPLCRAQFAERGPEKNQCPDCPGVDLEPLDRTR